MTSAFPEYSPTQPETLRRLPRTLQESPALSPSWRYEQAIIYSNCWEKDPTFELPEWENDDDVVRLYSYLRYDSAGPFIEDRRFNYAMEAVRGNPVRGTATRFKSLIVAGLSPEEIARRSWCDVESVEVFEKIFFDARPWLGCVDFVASVIFPFTLQRSEPMMLKKERLWLSAAFLLGLAGLEEVMHRKINLTTENLNRMSKMFNFIALSQGVEFLLAARSKASAQPEDFDRAVNLMHVPKDQTAKTDDSTMVNFAGGIVQALDTNSGGVTRELTKMSTDDPIYQLADVAVGLGASPEVVRLWMDMSEIETNNSGRRTPSVIEFL